MNRRAGTVRNTEPKGEGGGAFDCGDRMYHTWRTSVVTAGRLEIRLVSKPGVPSFGELDPSAALLLDHLEVGEADVVVDLHAGSGVVGALAARAVPRGRVYLADRNILSVEASRRTLAANGIGNAEVFFSDGTSNLPAPPADVALVRLPKGKLPTLQLLWDAFHLLRPGGRCFLAGGKDEGIKSALRQMEELFGSAEVLGYRGGHRVAMAIRGAEAQVEAGEFDVPWLDHGRYARFTIETRGGSYEIESRPGVFSWDRLDRGSNALIQAMEVGTGDRVLEIGCGFGIVGLVAARLSCSGEVVMTDVDVEAVHSSTRSVDANGLTERCRVLPSDVASAVADERFDVVVTNPPFHVGKATNLDVPAQFIRDAFHVLSPGGRLFLVANRTLPYERWVGNCFGSFQMAYDGREFKVISAVKHR